MKVHKVSGFTGQKTETLWVGSKIHAGKARKELMTRGSKRKDLMTTEINIPVDKQGLLTWLNENMK
tara:strand:+ start:3504 stop:3701 length:198 start_codon:yes stop_codon:yes gene_type:complete